MNLPRTINVVCEAWTAAENELVNEVGEHNPGIAEEGITERFFVLLQVKLKDASEKKLIETAFERDLYDAHPDIQPDCINRFSHGLIAEALHNRYVEGRKTAGDFGLILSNPKVERAAGKLYVEMIQNGLLCQAKLKRKTWGQLTKAQTKILPLHLDYSALTLYSFKDKQFRELCVGQWFSCKGSSVGNINEQLKNGFDPARLKNSTNVLRALARQEIGTHNSENIKNFIVPEGSRSFEVRIWWKDRDEHYSVLINTAHKQEQAVLLRQ